MENVAKEPVLYQQFSEKAAEDASIPAPWTEINQEELDAVRNAPIKLSNTVYGQFEEKKKRGIKRAYAKMSAKEKETLKWRMAEINKADAGNNESMPPSLTPCVDKV